MLCHRCAVAVGAGSNSEQRPELVSGYGGAALLDATTAQLAAARAGRDYPLWRAALFCASNLVRFGGPQGDGFRRRLLDHGGWVGGGARHRQGPCSCRHSKLASRSPSAALPCPPARPPAPPPGLEAELLIARSSKDAHVKAVARQAEAGLDVYDGWQRHCFHCGAAEEPDSGSKHHACGGCKRRIFCSRDCLKAAWKAGHRGECALLAPL